MFFALPVRDEPRPRFRPWVVYGLIALNALIYLLITLPMHEVLAAPDDPRLAGYFLAMGSLASRHPTLFDLTAWEWGFRANAPLSPTVISYMFVHDHFMHVFGNMLFLWVAGPNVERSLGWWRFAIAYLATGVAAAAAFAFFSQGSPVPMIGASGAVFGVLGSYFLWFPNHRVVLLVVVLWFVRLVRVHARWVLGVYVVVADLLPFVLGEKTQVAHSAHIGGFLAGLGVGFVAQRLGWIEHALGMPESRHTAAPTSIDTVQSFEDAVARERWDMALALYARLSPLQLQGVSAQCLVALAQQVAMRGEHDLALSLLRHLIVTRPTSPVLPQAHLAAGLIHLRGLHQLWPAYQHMLMVLDLQPAAHEEAAARAVLKEIEQARAAERRSMYD